MILQQVPTTTSTGVVSYLTMRKTIDWLGMLLPPMLEGNDVINNERTMNNKKVDINCNYEINVTIFTAITNNTVV